MAAAKWCTHSLRVPRRRRATWPALLSGNPAVSRSALTRSAKAWNQARRPAPSSPKTSPLSWEVTSVCSLRPSEPKAIQA